MARMALFPEIEKSIFEEGDEEGSGEESNSFLKVFHSGGTREGRRKINKQQNSILFLNAIKATPPAPPPARLAFKANKCSI